MKPIVISVLMLTLVSSLAYAISNDADLVLYCSFDEGSGDSVKDMKSGLSGAITGAKWSKNGKYGGAMEFVNAADNVQFDAENILDITKEITMEAWVLPNAVQGDSGVMGRRSAANTGGYCMQWTAGKFEMWLNVNGGGWQGTRDKQAIIPKPGEWHHIACVYDGKEELQYVDGELDVKFAAAGEIASIKDTFRIGQAQTNLSAVIGLVDEVAVYKRALSLNEVKKDMNEGVYSAVSPAGNLASTWGGIKGIGR